MSYRDPVLGSPRERDSAGSTTDVAGGVGRSARSSGRWASAVTRRHGSFAV